MAKRSSQIDFQKKSKQLFLQWKRELERYTDVHPVYYNAPPLTTTKVKAFTFHSETRERNSPTKETLDTIKTANQREESRHSITRSRKKLKISKFFKIRENYNSKRAKTPNKQIMRKTFTRSSQRRPKTRREHTSRFEILGLHSKNDNWDENKIKINFNKIVMDSIMSRPVTRQSEKSQIQNTKNMNVKFNNVFIF